MIRLILKLVLKFINMAEDVVLKRIKNKKVRKLIDQITDWLYDLVK